MFKINLVFLMLMLSYVSCDDFYTSLVNVESVLSLQSKVIRALDASINNTKEFLNYLNDYRNILEDEFNIASLNKKQYIGNALNVFRFFKLLSYDLTTAKENHKQLFEHFDDNLSDDNTTYPDDMDLHGVVSAISRLRATYDLNVEDLANGKINDDIVTKPLIFDECMIIANKHFDIGDYYYSLSWTKVALSRLTNKDVYQRIAVHQTMADIYEAMNDKANVIQTYDKLIAEDPEEPLYLIGKAKFLMRWRDKIANDNDTSNFTEAAKGFRQESGDYDTDFRFSAYESLCRIGEKRLPPAKSRDLVCYHDDGGSMFLKIAPIKAEMMSIQPEIILFHEIISDNEIEQIKEYSKPLFKRSLVNADNEAGKETSNIRISNTAWMDNNQTVEQVLNRRVEAVTRMTTVGAEFYQVVNYGVGGYYIYHADYFDDEQSKRNNRIATVLFYLSDVELGGSTVFPEIGVAIPPRKGTAVYWRNLFLSTDVNPDTYHASCPVLKGDKWICTKWIWSLNQAFLQPCGLQDDSEWDEYEEFDEFGDN